MAKKVCWFYDKSHSNIKKVISLSFVLFVLVAFDIKAIHLVCWLTEMIERQIQFLIISVIQDTWLLVFEAST